jgi:LysR family transcriptional regulator, transcriptional activator for dmlA
MADPARAAIAPADLGFFATLAGRGSLSAAAREMGVSTAAVSKRLAAMEARLGLALLVRTTRRLLGSGKAQPRGLLRVNATLGFGRSHVGPLISRFARRHPEVQVQLQLSVTPPPLTDDLWDVCIRFGPPPEARVVARLLARNRRLLCAAPAYLAAHGEPKAPADLVRHNCIGIRQGDEAYGLWRLTPLRGRGTRAEAVKTRGTLTTNDGEIAVNWALDGHGILMRAEWDVARHLKSGRLVQVLPHYATPDADLYAVYPPRLQLSARVRAFVDFIAASFG